MRSKKENIIGLLFLTVFLFLGMMLYYLLHTPTITVNADGFRKEGNYSKESLQIFAEVAFPYNHIRKWNEDIKVEIFHMDKLDQALIDEVDSIIRILSPLIHPVKIYKVSENGNLKVHRKVDAIVSHGDTVRKTMGFCYIPSLIKRLTWDINYAEVYEIWYGHCIFHEFLHAIGLQHASKEYPFHMNMQDRHNYYSPEEVEKYTKPLYILEEEKLAIKMLYSPYIKSGLRKEKFLKKMNLNDNDTFK